MPVRPPNHTPPFNIVRASHAELGVRDLAASKAFYVDCLGFLVSDETAGKAVEAIVKADRSVTAVSAASILAKTVRDTQMEQLDARYPGFNLAGHKGYPTPHHLRCLNELGPSPLHRNSFAPVRLARG